MQFFKKLFIDLFVINFCWLCKNVFATSMHCSFLLSTLHCFIYLFFSFCKPGLAEYIQSRWEREIRVKPGPKPTHITHINFGVSRLGASDSMRGMCVWTPLKLMDFRLECVQQHSPINLSLLLHFITLSLCHPPSSRFCLQSPHQPIDLWRLDKHYTDTGRIYFSVDTLKLVHSV